MADKGKGEKKEEGGTSWMPDFEKLKPEMPDFEKFKPDFDGLKPEKLNEHKDKLVESFSKPAIDKLVCEFVGTFLLVFTVGCNSMGGLASFSALSIASVLMITVYMFGPVSGAHFNPAVTIAIIQAGKIDWALGSVYIAVQSVAGILGACLSALVYAGSLPFGPLEGGVFAWQQALTVEFIYTFMLCLVVLSTACCKAQNQYFGLAIGFVIVAGGNAAGWVSGAAFNPAVALGLDCGSFTTGWGWCITYILVEVLAAVSASLTFEWLRPGEMDKYAAGPDPSDLIPQRLVSEALGTFFLVLTVGLNVLQGPMNAAAGLSIASSLMCMIYALAPVSGAHFNPAVTVAIFVSGRDKISVAEVGMYSGAQIGGALVAGLTYSVVCGGMAFGLGPYGEFGWLQVAVAEFVFTFLLCSAVLAVATVSNNDHAKDFFGLVIGFCIIVGGYAVGGVSGGALNPAVAIAIDTVHAFSGGGYWWGCIIYTLIELGAGAAAAGVFMLTHPGEFGDKPRSAKV